MEWLKYFRDYKREYRVHALERMVERNISFEELDEAFLNLEIVETYLEDIPFPSCLAMGHTKKEKPVHIVFAVNETEEHIYIITVYEPDPKKWEYDLRRRKK